jgi:hypothetical protein
MAILSCHVSIKLPPKISDGQKIREAYARGISLIYYDRFSAGAEAYRAAATAYLVGQDQPALGTSKRVDDGEPGIEKEDSSLRRHLDTSNPPPTVLISDGP